MNNLYQTQDKLSITNQQVSSFFKPLDFKYKCATNSHHQNTKKGFYTNHLDVLKGYSSHGLADLKGAALMDRVDTKYIIPLQQLPYILAELKADYSALEMQTNRVFTYHNTYFDTLDHHFYHAHHQGKLNRYKVRHRHYVDTKTGFLEVKFKNNKGRTIKSRIQSPKADINSPQASEFLASKLQPTHRQLKPTQFGSYQRIALANEASCERITFDLNLSFSAPIPSEQFSNNQQASIYLPHMFIAELKQSRHDTNSPFARLMAHRGIRPSKFSKYCIGCSLVNANLKANRFKPELMAIQQLH